MRLLLLATLVATATALAQTGTPEGTVRAPLSATNLTGEFFYESGGSSFLALHPPPCAFRCGVTL
ncbi:MAG: hypothetical protein AAGI91_06180 [Bacteroidota bacterium]